VIRSAAESSIGPALKRESLTGLTPEVRFLGRNLSKADVSRYTWGGRRIAVKDYGSRPFVARQTLGRLLIGRECRAYEQAGAAPGLAPFLGRLGPFTLATGWVESVPLSDLPRGGASPEIFDALDTVIAGLHRRGVAIADLHHRDVLIAADGAVHVVDLAAAYVLSSGSGWFRRRIFERLRAQDRLAAARMRARFTGVPEEDVLAKLDPQAVRLWGAGRRVKAFWDRLRRRRA